MKFLAGSGWSRREHVKPATGKGFSELVTSDPLSNPNLAGLADPRSAYASDDGKKRDG
jgi:hypothetical protein